VCSDAKTRSTIRGETPRSPLTDAPADHVLQEPGCLDIGRASPEPVLGGLGLKLKRHWETYLPNMVAELRAQGTLDERLHEIEQQMLEQEVTLMQQGMSADQARETTREIGFLPEENSEAEEPPASTTGSATMTPPSTRPDPLDKKDPLLEKHSQRVRKALNGLHLKIDPPQVCSPPEASDLESKLPVTPRPQPDPLDKKDPLLRERVLRRRKVLDGLHPKLDPPPSVPPKGMSAPRSRLPVTPRPQPDPLAKKLPFAKEFRRRLEQAVKNHPGLGPKPDPPKT
jgi:hypothetical protein